MQAIISEYNESETCTWCEKENEGVTVEFDGGFLQRSPLCWKCLQKAVKVRHKQQPQQLDGYEVVDVMSDAS